MIAQIQPHLRYPISLKSRRESLEPRAQYLPCVLTSFWADARQSKVSSFAGAACFARLKKCSKPCHTVPKKLHVRLCVVQQVIQQMPNEPLQLISQVNASLSLRAPVQSAAPVGWRSTTALWNKKRQLSATSIGCYEAELMDGSTSGAANWVLTEDAIYPNT